MKARSLPYAVALSLLLFSPYAKSKDVDAPPIAPTHTTLGEFFHGSKGPEGREAYAASLIPQAILAGVACPNFIHTDHIAIILRFRKEAVRWFWMAQFFRDGTEPAEADDPLIDHWHPFVRYWCGLPDDEQ